jgi:hypothetical protein
MLMNDRHLTQNFTFNQLTRTDHSDLQEENRHVTAEEELKLVVVAELLEKCREVLGCELDVHSGRRYLELNKRVGGSDRSQHLKCEAADFSPAGPDSEATVTDAWQKIATASRAGKLKFGQLIVESAAGRDGGRSVWVHISLGTPYRDAARCGEVLSMKDGKYTLISKIA